jgi:hypothetical protein
VTGVLLDTYPRSPVHAPRQVFADPAVAIAEGADAVTGIEVLRGREALFAAVASMPRRHGGCWTGSMRRTWSGVRAAQAAAGIGLAGAEGAGGRDQGGTDGMRMPGAARPAAVIGAASPAGASLNAMAAVVPGMPSGSPMVATGRGANPAGPPGSGALGVRDDGH